MKYTIENLRDDLSRDFGGGHVSATKTHRFKGGGGGDGGAAARKQQEDARIAQAIKELNNVFGVSSPGAVDRNQFYYDAPTTPTGIGMVDANSPKTMRVFDQAAYDAAVKKSKEDALAENPNAAAREQLYSKIGTDAKNVAMTDLNKERGISERELKFSLARNGLSGGSRDIDANRDVLDTYQQGVLKASNLGTQTSNEARSSDEKTRVNLINSIQAGLTSGDAVQQAYAGMSNNAAAAQDAANSASLAGFFDVLRQQQANNQYQKGVDSVYVPGMTAKSTNNTARSSYGGTVRSVA